MWVPKGIDWAIKPPCGTPLRTDGHWSVQGLVWCLLYNEGAGNAVGGYAANANIGWKNDGVILGYDCPTNRYTYTYFSFPVSLSTFSVILFGSDPGANKYPKFNLNDGSAFKLQYDIDSNFFTTRYNGASNTGYFSSADIYRMGNNFAFTYDGNRLASFANNQYRGAGTSISISGITTLQVGISWGGNESWNLPHSFFALYKRALPDHAILSLLANPYQVCQP